MAFFYKKPHQGVAGVLILYLISQSKIRYKIDLSGYPLSEDGGVDQVIQSGDMRLGTRYNDIGV